MPVPDVPRSPLFDGRHSRGKEGFSWMSEMTLEDLAWWAKKTRESVERGGEYAERNAKSLATLEKWITWRTLYPDARWSGKRGDERVTAEAPARKPAVHPWGPRNDTKKKEPETANGSRNSAPSDDRGEEPEGYGF